MIIARGEAEGKRVLILGVTRGNIDRLVAGQPISLTRESHGEAIAAGEQIVIAFGEDEQELVNQLGAGIGPGTKVNEEPRLRDTPK